LIMKEKLLKFKDFVEMLDKRVHKIKWIKILIKKEIKINKIINNNLIIEINIKIWIEIIKINNRI
jgi:hypothetical protein